MEVTIATMVAAEREEPVIRAMVLMEKVSRESEGARESD